jgi:hypothetical protein
MKSDKFLKELALEQKGLSSRIFDLAIGRVFRGAYATFDKTGKENMDKTFLSDADKEKEKFIKKYMPNFKKLFKEEVKKIEAKIKAEIKI